MNEMHLSSVVEASFFCVNNECGNSQACTDREKKNYHSVQNKHKTEVNANLD